MQISFVESVQRLAHDVDLDPFTLRYVLKRLRFEGATFLTVTLPKFSKFVLASIEHGSYLPKAEMSDFSWKSRSPRVFQGFLCKIFDDKGVVRVNACADSLRRLRQFCDYFYKLALDFSSTELQKAEEKFVTTDESLVLQETDHDWVDKCRKNIETYYPSLKVQPWEVMAKYRPRFTSGTFASDVKNETVPYYVYKQLPGVCSSALKSFSGNEGYFKSYPGSPEVVELNQFDTASSSELLFVPKDSRGPRTICREPLHNLRAQMSFFDFMVSSLERDTRHRINFRDQGINQRLVAGSSVTREYSTIDLKDASDRVDNQIIRALFVHTPAVRFFTERRSKTVKLPSGKIHTLKKLAGMGSGLTFPLMALLIHCTICTLITERTSHTYRDAMSMCYVYGDDIVVPTRYFGIALEALSKVKLFANKSKCYTKSYFRESCGADYFRGVKVAPVRLRMQNSKPSVAPKFIFSRNGEKVFRDDYLTFTNKDESIYQLERHCRELVKAGMRGLALYYYNLIEDSIGELPCVSGDSPILGRYQLDNVTTEVCDTAGNIQTLKCVCPVVVRREFDGTSPYAYLKHKLSQRYIDTKDMYDETIEGSPFGEFIVPRRIVLRKVERSLLALHI